MQKLKDPRGVIYSPSYKRISFWAKIVAIILALALAINCYLYLNSHFAKIISGSSMYPNLNATSSSQKDIVLVNKFATVKRGDIVIINTKQLTYFDARGTKLLVKRVIALGGDKIKIIHNDLTGSNEIWLNGEKITEDYIAPDTNESSVDTFNAQANWIIKCQKDEEGYITIPEGKCFFLGDNRNGSLDSRYIGPLDNTRVLGVVDAIVYDYTLWHDIVATLLQFDLNF